MAESQVLDVIRVWAAVAWADGVLAVAEAEGLRRLIRTADLTDDERIEAGRMLDAKVELPDAYLARLDPEARRGIYRAACKMAIVDHTVNATERSVLGRLAAMLEIPADVAREIEADVPNFR